MLDRTIPLARLSDCQDEHFMFSDEHAVALEVFALTSAINALMRRAASPQGRDLLRHDAVQLGEYTNRLAMITTAVETRAAAEI